MPITSETCHNPCTALFTTPTTKGTTRRPTGCNDGILDNLEAIKVYPIDIKNEEELAREIARIANLSMALGYKLEDEGWILSREEAYQQISHSVSLFRGVLRYVDEKKGLD